MPRRCCSNRAAKRSTPNALRQRLSGWNDSGRDVAFVIGGPDGLAPTLSENAALHLAFGALTWPHQLVRIMLLEQIYRAITILSGIRIIGNSPDGRSFRDHDALHALRRGGGARTLAAYEAIARGVAADEEIIGFLLSLPKAKQQPNLLLAAVRHLSGTPTDWPGFRRSLLANREAVRAVMQSHATQTNEPARCATLLPVLGAAAAAAGC